MPILTNDLVILASELMDDSAYGGGGLVERQIVDGQSNNIFKDISRLARTYGGVNLREVFAAVRTQTNETLLGAFVFLDKIPGDKKLGISLFSTGGSYDVRDVAAARIENYRAQGGRYQGFLQNTQYNGSQIVTLFQMESAPIPAIGDVLMLKRLAPDHEQFIRVTSVSTSIQNFTDSNGSFRRKVVLLGIATPLKYDFPGIDITRLDGVPVPTQMFNTAIANAARYYSARPLKNNALLGAYKIYADSIYAQVVPSTQAETPLTDLTAAGSITPLIASSTNFVGINIGYAVAAGVSIYLGRAVYPNTLTLASVIDKGGELMIGSLSVGSISYQTGTLVFNTDAPYLGSGINAQFKPAGIPLTVADTDLIPITDASRSTVYVFNINPPPQPGAVSVSYMAMGNWYEFKDNGSGYLVPLVDGTGAGTINYVTGSGTLTCASLPDVGSGIILAWGKKTDYTSRAGSTVQCAITKQLTHDYINAASLTITWVDAQAVGYTINCNAAGVLSGAGTGQLNANLGLVKFIPTTLPANGTVFHFTYQWVESAANVIKISKPINSFNYSGTTALMDLQDVNIVPGSFTIAWDVGWGSTIPQPVVPFSPGEYLEFPNPAVGIVKKLEMDNGTGGLISGRSCTINYSTGIVEMDCATPIALKFPWLATGQIAYVGIG